MYENPTKLFRFYIIILPTFTTVSTSQIFDHPSTSMNILNKIFNWRTALYWHTVWFSLALLQQTFLLGQLWTITNVFVFILLLRCVYGPQPELANNCAICWYFYCLSVFTDLLSIAVFGTVLADSTDLYRFILASACMMFIPKPFFAVFLYKDLQQSGFSLKTGMK